MHSRRCQMRILCARGAWLADLCALPPAPGLHRSAVLWTQDAQGTAPAVLA
jgi:hypothetical protein